MTDRRRPMITHTAEEEALDKIARDAEERIQKKRQARAEARSVRLRELERQQREADEAERRYELTNDSSRSKFSRALSGSAHNGLTKKLDDEFASDDSKALLEKLNRTLCLYSQVDNEKSVLLFEVDLLRDDLEELQENYTQLHREYADLQNNFKDVKRTCDQQKADEKVLRKMLEERDLLIAEAGLVFVEKEADEVGADEEGVKPEVESDLSENSLLTQGLLLSRQTIHILEKACPEGTVDERIKKLVAKNRQLQLQLDELQSALTAEKMAKFDAQKNVDFDSNSAYDPQKDVSKQLADLKFKLQEVERENSSLQANVVRLESHVKRYKTQAEQAEKDVDELKQANRQYKKELREKECALDDAQETNKHLQSRLERLHASHRGPR